MEQQETDAVARVTNPRKRWKGRIYHHTFAVSQKPPTNSIHAFAVSQKPYTNSIHVFQRLENLLKIQFMLFQSLENLLQIQFMLSSHWKTSSKFNSCFPVTGKPPENLIHAFQSLENLLKNQFMPL
ncbi:MAG: hypothetical protein LBR10_07930 [Prevotellaceae bacterium]|nr:hypothetical protein [Prevotellaceae bacterium]